MCSHVVGGLLPHFLHGLFPCWMAGVCLTPQLSSLLSLIVPPILPACLHVNHSIINNECSIHSVQKDIPQHTPRLKYLFPFKGTMVLTEKTTCCPLYERGALRVVKFSGVSCFYSQMGRQAHRKPLINRRWIIPHETKGWILSPMGGDVPVTVLLFLFRIVLLTWVFFTSMWNLLLFFNSQNCTGILVRIAMNMLISFGRCIFLQFLSSQSIKMGCLSII